MRKFLLSILLTLWIAPAFGQVCPAVAALPDSERRVSYSISASTGPLSVTFPLLGDGVDAGAWLEVWVGDVLKTFTTDWTLSIPSGTLATACRPITNASVNFVAPQTGVVQLVGARRPRRTSQFPENAGVPTRNLNQVITDLTAQNRETWDKINDVTGRGLFSQPGNTMGPLPLPSACVNSVLAFDATGLLPQCVSFASGGVVFGNPTATVKLAATNGTAITVMRSDAAPALDQTIVPTWTGLHSFSAGVHIAAGQSLDWGDLFISRGAAARIRLGQAATASPIAQTLAMQNVSAGTTDTAGANFTIVGSSGTGTGVGGAIVFQTSPASTTGSTQNASVEIARLNPTGFGIGMVPDTYFSLSANPNPPAVQTVPMAIMHIVGPNAAGSTPIQIDTFGGAFSQIMRRANGTGASPTALINGDSIWNFTARGWDGTSYSDAGTGTAMEVRATENWAVGAHGAKFLWRINYNGTAVTANVAFLGQGYHVGPTAIDPGPGIISAETGFRVNNAAAVAGHVLRANGTNYVDAALAAADLSNGTNGTGAVALTDSPVFTTQITSPILVGGTTAGSTAIIRSTSGAGTTDAVIIQVGNAGAMEAARWNTSGQYVQGSATAQAMSGSARAFNVYGTSAATAGTVNGRWTADANGYSTFIYKSRNAAIGSHTVVQSGDTLGSFIFKGDDGVSEQSAAQIAAVVDATPGANDMPGRLVFSTTPDGANTLAVRMSIFNDGGAAFDAVTTSPGAGAVRIGAIAVASLPTCNAAAEGSRASVNNSNAASFAAGIGAVVAGGGTVHVPVYCDGSSWRIG